MVLKTAYLEIKGPTKYCPFVHGEIYFSNGTKCPVYFKNDACFILERAKELSLIDEIEFRVLESEINKSDLTPEMDFAITEKGVRKDFTAHFHMLIVGLLEEVLQKAKSGETLELNLKGYVQEKFKELEKKEDKDKNFSNYKA